MEDWKDILVERIKAREERSAGIERMVEDIESTLRRLLKEMSFENSVKTNLKSKRQKDDSPYWIIQIEDLSVELNSENLYRYLAEKNDLNEALIQFLLDHFTFTD